MRNASHSLSVSRRPDVWVYLFVISWIGLGDPAVVWAETSEKRYGKYTLDEWQQIVKSTDFSTLGNPEIVQGLLLILDDRSAPQSNRKQAAETLGRIGEPARDAVPVLTELLQTTGEQSLTTKLYALKGLSLFGNVAQSACDEVSKLILDQTQPFQVRVNAMETLGQIGKNDVQTLPTFLQILRREDNGVGHQQLQMSAVEAMWYLGPQAAAALPDLIRAASHEWPLMRLAAVTTIGQIGPRAEIAIPLLADTILFDESPVVREYAADSLGQIGGAAIPALEQLATDADLDVRQLAIRACKKLPGQARIQEILEILLRDTHDSLRVLAAEALLEGLPTHSAAIETLVSALASEHRMTRRLAYGVLLKNKSELTSVRDALRECFLSPQSPAQSKTAARKLLNQLEN